MAHGRPAVARVVNHLNCFGRYYTEEYLQFLHEWTGVAAVVELMASLDAVHRSFIDFLDFERSFVDGTAWIVPFAEVGGRPGGGRRVLWRMEATSPSSARSTPKLRSGCPRTVFTSRQPRVSASCRAYRCALPSGPRRRRRIWGTSPG